MKETRQWLMDLWEITHLSEWLHFFACQMPILRKIINDPWFFSNFSVIIFTFMVSVLAQTQNLSVLLPESFIAYHFNYVRYSLQAVSELNLSRCELYVLMLQYFECFQFVDLLFLLWNTPYSRGTSLEGLGFNYIEWGILIWWKWTHHFSNKTILEFLFSN